ncbi:MAG: C39 family peptidase [Deltaproteobacteria bacterium]|nr:C39 family peptidase [Deltaproteobacteria bacterium]
MSAIMTSWLIEPDNDPLAYAVHVYAGESSSCGPACVLIAARFLDLEPPAGATSDQSTLERIEGTMRAATPGWTSRNEYHRALRELGAQPHDMDGAPLHSIADEVRQGNPVIVIGRWPWSDSLALHAIVVTGYDDGHTLPWIVNDPAFPRPYRAHNQEMRLFRRERPARPAISVRPKSNTADDTNTSKIHPVTWLVLLIGGAGLAARFVRP